MASRSSFFTRRLPQLLPNGMGQVHGAPALLEHVGRPVPAVGGFEDHFGVLAGLGQLGRQGDRGRCRCGPSRGSRRPRFAARSRCAAGAGRCRRIVVAVPRESPSVVSGLVWQPQVCFAHLVPGDGRTPVGPSSSIGLDCGRRCSLPRDRSSCSAPGPVRSPVPVTQELRCAPSSHQRPKLAAGKRLLPTIAFVDAGSAPSRPARRAYCGVSVPRMSSAAADSAVRAATACLAVRYPFACCLLRSSPGTDEERALLRLVG